MNIVVLGGGSAGWLTALLVREFHPHHNITVVESDDIGIAGVGESTVPHFISVLDTLNIPVSDLVKYCSSTLKTGIRFENWNGDGESYFHPFHGQPGVSISSCDSSHFVNLIQTKEIALGQKPTAITEMLSQECKVPFSYANRINSQQSNPILRLENHAHFALHFDTKSLALFLRRVAVSRNIRRIEGKVVEINNDLDGNVRRLVLDNGVEVPVGFIFDCSGFARLIIGKHYQTPWNSYRKHLPMKSAVPFLIPHNNKNIRPDTACIAMKYGWMWQIPVQDRYGCGYVFDSDYISREEALKEVEEYLGHPVESTKTFNFDAGVFESTYVKNCMAVGLSQSFVEPLESTSILVSCMNILQFLKNNGIFSKSEEFRNQFNRNCRDRNTEILEFIYLHYMTTRSDSEFWRNFRSKTEIPPGLAEKLAIWRDVPPGEYVNENNVFSLAGWLHIAAGVKQLDPVAFAHRMVEQNIDRRLGNNYYNYLSNLNTVVKGCMGHQEFIEYLKNN